MNLRMIAGALALALLSAVPAAARPAYARVMCAGTYCTIVNVPDPHEDARPGPPRRAPIHRASESRPHADASAGGEGVAVRRPASRFGGEVVPHPAGCPPLTFCGCGASIEVFGRSVRALWRAAAWLVFPPAPPARGMAAVRLGDDQA